MADTFSFGDWVRKRRRALDLTQDELAQRVGCAVSMVRKIELDERRPSKQLAALLATGLELPEQDRAPFLKAARAETSSDRLAPPTAAILERGQEPYGRSMLRLDSIPSRPGNLPLALTSFIGREHECAAIRELLATQRLVTLTGPGGTGKTRLAIEVAASVQESFPHGVWLVELAPLADPALVLQAVASTLGLREEAGRLIQTVLTDFLRGRTLLLLLDNCEHLVDACAKLVEMLLRTCPQIRLLASSREALGVPGEALYRVPPLRTPDPRQLPGRAALIQFEAVRLFTERATAALPGFQVTDANMTAIAQVCVRLDGIPLAIELAAARMRALRVEQIAARLDDRFQLLTGASRTALPRQQTLRALIDWSYDLLTPEEQQLLQRLAVCVGGWSLATAEAVGEDVSDDPYVVLELLTRLVDKSLVQVDRAIGSETRYTMLETIRQYALERLAASGDRDTVRRQHAAHFLHWIETTQPHLSGIEQRSWLDQLELEHDNLRAALSWATDQRDTLTAGSIVRLLEWFWFTHGRISEGRAWFEQTLGIAAADLALAPMRAVIGRMAGYFAFFQADYPSAEHWFMQSLALFRELGDQTGTANLLINLAMLDEALDRIEQAYTHCEESLILRQKLGEVEPIADALYHRGRLHLLHGDILLARDDLDQALSLFRSAKNVGMTPIVLGMLGYTLLAQDAALKALPLFHEALVMLVAQGNDFITPYSLMGVAGIFAAEYQGVKAAHILGFAHKQAGELGLRVSPGEQSLWSRIEGSVRTQLSPDAFDVAFTEGQALTLDQAVAEALALSERG